VNSDRSAPAPSALRAYRKLADAIRIERVMLRLASLRLSDALLVAGMILLAVLPLLFIRAYHYEEGLTVAFAKEAMRGARWYDPTLYGYRFVERPVLQSWLVAIISLPFGTVTQLTARLPTIIAVLSSAWLILHLLRGKVSRTAGLFAALCFVFSPMVLQKIIVAESEILLAVTQFAAFVVWWKGVEAGRVSLSRWTAIGVLLLATACFKGPQPAAFFALGIGSWIVLRREWAQVPGYCLAGLISLGGIAVWYMSVLEPSDGGNVAHYMRLELPSDIADYLAERFDFATIVVQFLPATLLLVPAALDLVRRTDYVSASNRALLTALALYGGLTLIPLALWPETQPRYAMTALLPAACIAGLAFDATYRKLRNLARFAIATLLALVVYQMVWGWLVAPVFWDEFASSRLDAQTVAAAAPDTSRPIMAPPRSADAVLAYLDRPIRYLSNEEMAAVAVPAYLLGWQENADAIAARRPDVAVNRLAVMRENGIVLFEVTARGD